MYTCVYQMINRANLKKKKNYLHIRYSTHIFDCVNIPLRPWNVNYCVMNAQYGGIIKSESHTHVLWLSTNGYKPC